MHYLDQRQQDSGEELIAYKQVTGTKMNQYLVELCHVSLHEYILVDECCIGLHVILLLLNNQAMDLTLQKIYGFHSL